MLLKVTTLFRISAPRLPLRTHGLFTLSEGIFNIVGSIHPHRFRRPVRTRLSLISIMQLNTNFLPRVSLWLHLAVLRSAHDFQLFVQDDGVGPKPSPIRNVVTTNKAILD